MVMPFWGMVGSFIGLIITAVANPILYKVGMLSNWKFGDDTIATLFKNNVDFYFSFHIGIAVAIAIVGFWQVGRHMVQSRREHRASGVAKGDRRLATAVPAGRGDIPWWAIALVYCLVTSIYIGLSMGLLRWYHGFWPPDIFRVLWILIFLGAVYTPLISYVTARLEGMVGEVVEIPMIREAALILSGYKGIACWFVPMPIAKLRHDDRLLSPVWLTGTSSPASGRRRSSSDHSHQFAVLRELHLGRIPSVLLLPLCTTHVGAHAATRCIMYSATMGEYSMFEEAWNTVYFACGSGFGVLLFSILQFFGTPIMLTYGVVRGLGQTIPHAIVAQFIGALIGQFYFKKRLGLKWRQYIPVVSAGFGCGMGLITTLGIGVTFLSKSAIKLPF